MSDYHLRHHLHLLPALIAAAAAILACASGCTQESKVSVAEVGTGTMLPTMQTTDVATLISDSGIVQYKIVSPLWQVWDECDTPVWRFPKGIYLEKYDRRFNVIATVAADSATYFKRQGLWRLDGNVEMHNAPADVFLTQQLFWDQRRHTLHSDSFIHVENASHIIEGHGFHSNEQLTSYRVITPTGIFPVNQFEQQ